MPKETEYDVVLRHRRLRVNFVQILQRTQILKGGRAMMDIPLCRMIGLQVVRSALAVDIEKLKANLVHGYRLALRCSTSQLLTLWVLNGRF